MATEFYVGETVHISADDLTLRGGAPVTTGATVVLDVLTAEGVVATTATITSPASGDDWGADLTLPSTAGSYIVRVSATKGGGVWKAKQRITVNAF